MTDRPTLILLPGLLCDDALWRHQIDHLGMVAEIVVPDLTSQDSIPAMADAVLAAAPSRFALAGLSMGGYVALEIMRRGGERVERLALLDTAARDADPTRNDQRRLLMDQVRHGQFKGVTRSYVENFLHPDHLADALLVSDVLAMTERVGREAFLRQNQAIIDRAPALGLLGKIACPTLVLCGRQDETTPLASSEELAHGIPGAHLVVIEECGHLSTMERPQAVTALLSYWLQR